MKQVGTVGELRIGEMRVGEMSDGEMTVDEMIIGEIRPPRLEKRLSDWPHYLPHAKERGKGKHD